MPSIEERLRLLEDERAIMQTLITYGHAIDYDYEAEFADLWVEDAILDWPEPRPRMVGREAILEAFRGHTHFPAAIHKHFVVDPRIVIDGDRATVDSYFARLDPYEEGPSFKSIGRYRDVLVRGTDGRWRFQHRLAEREDARRAP